LFCFTSIAHVDESSMQLERNGVKPQRTQRGTEGVVHQAMPERYENYDTYQQSIS